MGVEQRQAGTDLAIPADCQATALDKGTLVGVSVEGASSEFQTIDVVQCSCQCLHGVGFDIHERHVHFGSDLLPGDQVERAAKELGGHCVVKAQIYAGGRGKAGGVKLASTPDEAAEKAASDSSDEVRMVVAGSLVVKGAKEFALMKALLKDPAPGVVPAARVSVPY